MRDRQILSYGHQSRRALTTTGCCCGGRRCWLERKMAVTGRDARARRVLSKASNSSSETALDRVDCRESIDLFDFFGNAAEWTAVYVPASGHQQRLVESFFFALELRDRVASAWPALCANYGTRDRMAVRTRAHTHALRVSLRRSTCRRAQSPGNTAPVASAPSRSNRRVRQQFARCFEPSFPPASHDPLYLSLSSFICLYFAKIDFFAWPVTSRVGSIIMTRNWAVRDQLSCGANDTLVIVFDRLLNVILS